MFKMVLLCTLCSYRCDGRLKLVKHSFGAHSFDPSFRVVCGIRGCQHIFQSGSSFSSFKTHANRKHSNWQVIVNDPDSVNVAVPLLSFTRVSHASTDRQLSQPDFIDHSGDEPTTVLESRLELTQDQTSEPQNSMSVCSTCSTHVRHDAQEAAALFLLTFQEKYDLSQRAIDFAVGSIHTILDGVRETSSFSIRSLMENISSPPTLDEIVACIEDHEDVFAPLQTKYLQNKYYIDKFGLVVITSDFILWLH